MVDHSIPLDVAPDLRDFIDNVYRSESRRVFATLIRLLGDFDLAEEALHEAFAAASTTWAAEGVPSNPRAWLVSSGRFKAIDAMRRRARLQELHGEIAARLDRVAQANAEKAADELTDDRLRLIFTCCHPALAPSTQVALTLREVCGLTTEEIASAFLATPATIAQRIVRGKAKIREAGIPYSVPEIADLPERIESVLAVVYLVFNEGYSASTGNTLMRQELSEEAIRLSRLIVELLPDMEAIGLLALLLLQESRRHARTTEDGELVLLEDQDRSLWDQSMIREGTQLVQRAMTAQQIGSYTIQAAIAAVHADAISPQQTDWNQIVELYGLLLQASPSPIVELNRAVAIAMRDGPDSGLSHIQDILDRGELVEYHLTHAAKADLCRRLGRLNEARQSYLKALELVQQEPERRFLEKRLKELDSKAL